LLQPEEQVIIPYSAAIFGAAAFLAYANFLIFANILARRQKTEVKSRLSSVLSVIVIVKVFRI